jgi:hypothetical protein
MKMHTQLSKYADNTSSALETHADTHSALSTGNLMKIHAISSNHTHTLLHRKLNEDTHSALEDMTDYTFCTVCGTAVSFAKGAGLPSILHRVRGCQWFCTGCGTANGFAQDAGTQFHLHRVRGCQLFCTGHWFCTGCGTVDFFAHGVVLPMLCIFIQFRVSRAAFVLSACASRRVFLFSSCVKS